MHAGLARPNQLAPPGQLHRDRFAGAEIPYHRLYVGSLHFDLTADDVKQVFAPFGEIEFVDLHRDSMTGKSKGFCFVQCVSPPSLFFLTSCTCAMSRWLLTPPFAFCVAGISSSSRPRLPCRR